LRSSIIPAYTNLENTIHVHLLVMYTTLLAFCCLIRNQNNINILRVASITND
jgi:hypothetical protein